MSLQNVTFKLSEDDLMTLRSLADELGCNRTEVIRRALRAYQQQRARRHELADAFWRSLFATLPAGKMFMVGLEHGEPYVTQNGDRRLDDVEVVGQRFMAEDPEAPGGELEYVRVFFVDRDNEARYSVGAIPADGGQWIALDRPPTVKIS